MNIEDVAGERFTSGRTAQQKRKLAIGAGMVCEVIVDNEHIAAQFHKVFCDACSGVGCDVDKAGSIVALCDDYNCVVQSAFFAERFHNLCDCRSPLADSANNADYVRPDLITVLF